MKIIFINYFKSLAFILMTIYHYFVFKNLIHNENHLNDLYVHFIGVIARNLFLFICGINLYLSYKKYDNKNKYRLKKIYQSLLIYFCATIITIFTYYNTPSLYIVFGVLHFISLATFILHHFVNDFISLILIFSLCIIMNQNLNYFTIPYNDKSFLNYINSIIGIQFYKSTIDHFSIIKWFPNIIFGIFIGYIIYDYKHIILKINNYIDKYSKKNKIFRFINNILNYIGENTLLLYVFHFITLYYFVFYFT